MTLYGIGGRGEAEYRVMGAGNAVRIPVDVPPGVYVLVVESRERTTRRLVVVLE